MLVAKALYDNVAETPEELALRRGDLLTVIEQDTSGLEGWWLCALKGRRGIVPGNRLRVVDRALLGERELAQLTENDTPDRSLERGQTNKVVMPQRLGNMYVYDVPGRVVSGGQTDYDVPPSRVPTAAPRPTPRHSNADYDHPPSIRINSKITPVMDHHSHSLNLDHYDIPGSNRSSTISMMSTGSNMSAMSSGSGPHSSLCESERSSLDLSGHDTYDVPQPARRVPSPQSRKLPPGGSTNSPLYDTPKSQKLCHKHTKSLEIVEEHYDSLKPSAIIERGDSSLSYDMPKPVNPVSRNCSTDSGISLPSKNLYDVPLMQAYDVPIPQTYDTPSQRKSIDDNLDYDTPKPSDKSQSLLSSEVPPSDSNVYDVPPRVTKDTGVTLQEEEKRASSSSGGSESDVGPVPYDELRMELSAAMESIVSLQHNANSSCSKFLGYVHPSWRHPDNLEPKVYEIKLASIAVKKTGDAFVQFAQGALANAAKSEDTRLTKKLCSAVNNLEDMLDAYSQCLHRLNKDMWPLVQLVRYDDQVLDSPDDLDIIEEHTRHIPECVRSISGLIQGNSMVLFKRSGSPQVGVAPLTSTPKANKSKEPPPVKPKPRLSVDNGNGNGNGAPMAKFGPKSSDSPPTSDEVKGERPLPIIPDTGELNKTRDSGTDQMDYDVPKASTNLSESLSASDASIHSNHVRVEEYDYVSLTKDPNKEEKTVESSPPVVETEKENQTPVYAQVNKAPSRRRVKSLYPEPDENTSNGLSPKFQQRMEKLQKDSEEPVRIHMEEDYDVPQSRPVERIATPSRAPSHAPSAALSQILPNDRTILAFYSTQTATHANILINAIEAFLKVIEEQQPPKTFIAYSKFVIVAAHKLVYIGDTLTRHLVHDSIRNDVMNHAYTLCELLKVTVTATKKAALEYPSMNGVQDMVDRVSEVSVAVSAFKNFIGQFAS